MSFSKFISTNCCHFLKIVLSFFKGASPSEGSGNDQSNIVAKPIKVPPGVKAPKTAGIVGELLKALSPITQILLQLLDSYLKNMYGKSLPCRLDSITPLKGECTDLKTA